jgi:hypothetical protein
MRNLFPAEPLPSENVRVDRAGGNWEDGRASDIKAQYLVCSKTTSEGRLYLAYLHADRGRPSALYFVFMPEEGDTSQSSSIIKATYSRF